MMQRSSMLQQRKIHNKREPKIQRQQHAKDVLRIIPLGGQEEIGRNCILFEYGNDIVIIDMGLQWPEENMPGIDFIIPNIQYLRGKEKNVRGVCITHGHYDHIGAVPYLVEKLGNPPIYGAPLTLAFIKKRQEEFPQKPKLRLMQIRAHEQFRLGVFRVEFIPVAHSIPDAMAVCLQTPVGTILHTGDFKMDLAEKESPFIQWIKRSGRGKITMLLADSTNASQTGRQLSEGEIQTDLEKIFQTVQGRMLFAMFASNVSRVKQVLELALKYKRYVFVDGRSMKVNLEIARELGYVHFPKNQIRDVAEAKKFPWERSLILCTGAQGEERAVLNRIANREHRFVRIEKGDTVIFSSSVIPGNERSVQRLVDSLYREGADVINYRMMDIHAGGHAREEDLRVLHQLVHPRYLVPIYGHYAFLHAHRKVAMKSGMPENRVLIADNGQIIELDRRGARLTKKKVPTDYVFVDGLGVGDVSNVVLRDRQQMSEDGMLVVIVTIEGRTGRLLGIPDIISRGFVHMKESKGLIHDTQLRIKKLLKDHEPRVAADEADIRNRIRDDIGNFLFHKTQRRPLILPVIIEV
ncbi:MAG: ribonuclease J [bacterium]